MLHRPYYDPEKSYEANYTQGPFGAFSDEKKYANSSEPTYDFLGHKLYLPFGIPAGPLLNGKFVRAALDKGFDIATYKTVRSRSYPCHPAPNVIPVDIHGDLTLEQAQGSGVVKKDSYTQPIAVTNSFGVPSADPEVWQPDMKDAVEYAGKGQVVIGSFQATTGGGQDAYIADFVRVATLVAETGAPVLEANLSCPNEGTAHMLCFDVPTVEKISHAIKDAIGDTPLLLKLAYFSDQAMLTDLVKRIGNVVQGLVTINTIGAKVYNKDGSQALPGQGRLVSGICGAPIRWAGVEMVERLKKLREELQMQFAIIGCGGVTSASDYQAYRDAGADAVLSATGSMWNPYLAQEIKEK